MEYVSVEKARTQPGLRLVLTRGVPGPWSELAKAIFHVKGIPFVPVAQDGGGENADLVAWTGHANAPTAVYADEPPRADREAILFLAERLEPEPALLSSVPEERALALGLAHEIAGEGGLGWCRRLMMLDGLFQIPELPDDVAATRDRLARRYGYDARAAAAAPERVAALLQMLAQRLEAQRAAGRRFLVGDRLGIADLSWATFAALLQPLPAEQCPMPEGLRASYQVSDPQVQGVLHPSLLEHRDFVYAEYLELPLDF